MGEILIRYKDVAVYRQASCVLEGVNLELRGGEFVYLTGKVGTGKTSLLKTFYGEVDIQTGEATVLGYDMRRIRSRQVPHLRRKLGIVFQDFQLLTDRNVFDNLQFVLRATGWKDKDAMEGRINEVLKRVGMAHKGYKWPHELSGGEQQRVVIARAMLNGPQIILADEPTGNLDTETGRSITRLLHEWAGRGTLVVMATHNMQLMREFPGRVFHCSEHAVTEAEGIENESINDLET